MNTNDPDHAKQELEAKVGACLNDIAKGGKAGVSGFNTLFRMMWPRVIKHLLYKGSTHVDAEDIGQLVFQKLASSAKGRRADAPAVPWFWRVVNSVRIDEFRRSGPELHHDDKQWAAVEDTNASPDDTTSDQALNDCVSSALERFKRVQEDRAVALRLFHMEGWTIDELSGFLDRSYSATKQFLHECRKAFRPYIGPCLPHIDHDGASA